MGTKAEEGGRVFCFLCGMQSADQINSSSDGADVRNQEIDQRQHFVQIIVVWIQSLIQLTRVTNVSTLCCRKRKKKKRKEKKKLEGVSCTMTVIFAPELCFPPLPPTPHPTPTPTHGLSITILSNVHFIVLFWVSRADFWS